MEEYFPNISLWFQNQISNAEGGVGRAGVGLLLIIVFYSLGMALLAIISGLSLWPAANATKITTQINNSIVIMAQLFPIIALLGGIGLVLVLIESVI